VTNALKFENGRGVTVTVACRAGGAGGTAIDAAAEEDGSAAAAAASAEAKEAERGGGASTTHTLEVTVTDRGHGLSAAECERIFQAYEAAPSSRGGGTGLGLFSACPFPRSSACACRHLTISLVVAAVPAVSRACARRAGGDVSVRSAPGRGAAFTLRFPVRVRDDVAAAWDAALAQQVAAAPPAEESAAPAAAPTFAAAATAAGEPAAAPQQEQQQLRCLLAEDNKLNLLLVKRLLEQHAGFSVETAVNGREALDKLTSLCARRSTSPHVAVIDMQARPRARVRACVHCCARPDVLCRPCRQCRQMPFLSGPGAFTSTRPSARTAAHAADAPATRAEATRAFRAWEAAQPREWPRLPVYCLTANVLEEHRLECAAAGMDAGFLTKPLRADALADMRRVAEAHAQALRAADADTEEDAQQDERGAAAAQRAA
jgi:CheY-like chemotaxis protein